MGNYLVESFLLQQAPLPSFARAARSGNTGASSFEVNPEDYDALYADKLATLWAQSESLVAPFSSASTPLCVL